MSSLKNFSRVAKLMLLYTFEREIKLCSKIAFWKRLGDSDPFNNRENLGGILVKIFASSSSLINW